MDSSLCELEFIKPDSVPDVVHIGYKPKQINHEQMLSFFETSGIIWVDFTLNPPQYPELSGLSKGR